MKIKRFLGVNFLACCLFIPLACQKKATTPFNPEAYQGEVWKLKGNVFQEQSQILSQNPWYYRISNLSRQWQRIAEEAKNIRYLKLSRRYQKQATVWSDRAESIRELKTEEALPKVRAWLEKLPLPPPPSQPPRYYSGLEAFETIQQVHARLSNLIGNTDPLCLAEKNSLFQPLTLLVYAIDLLNDKNYQGALTYATRADQASLRIEAGSAECQQSLGENP